MYQWDTELLKFLDAKSTGSINQKVNFKKKYKLCYKFTSHTYRFESESAN